MPRLLRSVRLALHPAQTINQRFHKPTNFGKMTTEDRKFQA